MSQVDIGHLIQHGLIRTKHGLIGQIMANQQLELISLKLVHIQPLITNWANFQFYVLAHPNSHLGGCSRATYSECGMENKLRWIHHIGSRPFGAPHCSRRGHILQLHKSFNAEAIWKSTQPLNELVVKLLKEPPKSPLVE